MTPLLEALIFCVAWFVILGLSILAGSRGAYGPKVQSLGTSRLTSWHAGVVSQIHAMIATSVAAAAVVDALRTIPEEAEASGMWACKGSVWWRRRMLLCSAGYLMMDLGNVIVVGVYRLPRPSIEWDIFFHHAFISLSLVYSAHLTYAEIFLVSLLANEASTIFLNSRKFMLTLGGYEQTRAFFVNGICFVASFFFSRVAFIPLLFLVWLRAGACGLRSVPGAAPLELQGLTDVERGPLAALSTANFAILMVMNVVWFWKIIAGARKFTTGKKRE